MKKVNILITSGGTNEKIDEVRKITNMSTGALGKKIAKELIDNYEEKINTIFYVCSKHAKFPVHEKIKVVFVENTADLSCYLDEILIREQIDYFIHAMAISDYTTNFVSSAELLAEEIAAQVSSQTENLKEAIVDILKNPKLSKMDSSSKISSTSDNLMVALEPTEKIISKIKQLSPKTFLVGFKLLNNVSEEELFNTSFSLLRKNRCNLVLANDLSLIKKGEHTGMIVYPEKKYELTYGKENIAKTLTSVMFKRGETRYPSSINVSSSHNIDDETFNAFYQTGKSLFNSGHLPIVESGTYGNMSVKTDESFFITGRNVQKGNLTRDMLVSIEKVEEISKKENENIFTKVYYSGAVKPSIDTSIHHFIYKHTNYKAILHVHTDKIFYNLPLTSYNYACGTEEEMLSMLEPIKKNQNVDIVQMNKHGLIVLGESLQECLLKTDKLFNEELNIDTLSASKDKGLIDEWLMHYSKVYVEDEKYDLSNLKDFSSIKVGKDTVGILYKKENKDCLDFVLYSTESSRGKNLKIGEKIVNILTLISKTKEINKLTLLTSEACGVKDYYRKKLGFKEIPNNTELILMTLDI